MLNTAIRTLHEPDGSPVCNASFDLSSAQLRAARLACAEIVLQRHRGTSLEIDDVLALRELTAVCDELDRLIDAAGHATLVLPLARLVALHDALHDWTVGVLGRGWQREADEEALPVVQAMLGPMAALREDAVREALSTGERASHDR